MTNENCTIIQHKKTINLKNHKMKLINHYLLLLPLIIFTSCNAQKKKKMVFH